MRRRRPYRALPLAALLCLVLAAGSCRTTGAPPITLIDPAGEPYFDRDQCDAIPLLCAPDGGRRVPFQWAYLDAQLGELGEPSFLPLVGGGGEAYRVVVETSFDGRLIIRLDVRQDGSGSLTTWNPDGYCANQPISATVPLAASLDAGEAEGLRAVLEDAGFWTLPVADSRGGLDGTDWYVEGVRTGEHRVVTRSSPGGGAIPRVAEAFTAAAGCKHRPLEAQTPPVGLDPRPPRSLWSLVQ